MSRAASARWEDPLSGWCRQCGYSLRGLPEPRCPECGRAFDPADPRTIDFRPSWKDRLDTAVHAIEAEAARVARAAWKRLRPLVPLILCLLAGWYLYLLSPLPFLFWVPGVYLAWRRRWALVAGFAVLTPPSWYVASYSIEYATGSPRYVSQDSVYTEAGSIDPVTRVRRRNSGGCGTRPENEFMRRSFERTAEDLMFRLIGPPPGAYTGPYPTRTEAIAALATATPFDMPDDWEGDIKLPGGTVRIDWEWARRFQWPSAPPGAPPGPLTPRAVQWQGSCVIVRVPFESGGQTWARVYLIDTTVPQLFGMYEGPDL